MNFYNFNYLIMVEEIFKEIDSFADFHFGVQIRKEWENFIMNINLFWDHRHINREFKMIEKTEEKAIEKWKRTVWLIRQIRIGCWLLYKD